MATRGIVAVSTASEANGWKLAWKGRYSHWDNYPERMVEALGVLVARDGLDNVVSTLIDAHASWSSIDPWQTMEHAEKLGYAPEAVVEGYGVTHLDIEKDDPSSVFTHEDDDLAWAEWLYIIYPDSLEVRRIDTVDGRNITTYHDLLTWESIGKGVTA